MYILAEQISQQKENQTPLHQDDKKIEQRHT